MTHPKIGSPAAELITRYDEEDGITIVSIDQPAADAEGEHVTVVGTSDGKWYMISTWDEIMLPAPIDADQITVIDAERYEYPATYIAQHGPVEGWPQD